MLHRIDARFRSGGDMMDLDEFGSLINPSFQTAPDQLFNYRGEQLTLLKYLILNHDEATNNLSSYIDYILKNGATLLTGQPIHWALSLGKNDSKLTCKSPIPSVEQPRIMF